MIPKNERPPLPRPHVARPRLVEQILDCEVAVLTAPAGYGKSVLLTEALQCAGEPAALYRATGAGRAPDRLLAALREAGRGLIAIDGVEALPDAGSTWEALNEHLARGMRGCHLILAGRAIPPLPALSRLRLDGKVLELGPRDLLFSEAESQALLGRLAAEGHEAAHLAGGWPAALRLLAAHPAPNWAELFRFLESEVIAPLTAEERRQLTDLAVTANWTSEACSRLLERSDGLQLLARWERILPVDRQGLIHPLVRRCFAALLEREPERCRRLHRQAALLEVEHSEPEAALHHALATDDLGLAVPLLREVGARLLAAGRLDELDAWFTQAPSPMLEAAPELLLKAGEALRLSGRPRRGARWLQTAVLGFAAVGDAGGLLRALCRLALTHADRGEWSEMEAAIRQVEAEAADASGRERAEALRAMAEHRLALGRGGEAASGFRQAVQLFLAHADPEGAGAALIGLANALVAMDQPDEALSVLRQSQSLLGGTAGSEALLGETQILLDQGRWSEAEAILATADPRNPQQQALTLWARAQPALQRGDTGAARRLRAEGEALLAPVERTPMLQGRAALIDGWLALADGEAGRALACGRQASRLASPGLPLLRLSAHRLIAAAEASIRAAGRVVIPAGARPQLRVECFGAFRLFCEEQEVPLSHWGRAQVRTILQWLLLQPGFAASRESLLEILWPEESPAQSRTRLRVLLNRLRQALQQLGCSLEAGTEIIRLPRESVASVDIVTFRQHLAAARSLAGEAPGECIEQCRAGRALYRGELLENAFWPGLEVYRRQAERELVELLQLWRVSAVRLGRSEEAVNALEELLALEPGQEEAARELITLLIRSGRRGEAAHRYRQLARWLKTELGLDPSPETQALLRQALR